jgi:hypothetical protein
MGPKQKLSLQYNDALLDKFKQMKEVRKIHNKRILPKAIFKEGRKQVDAKETDRRKKVRLVKHSKMEVDNASLRQKSVLNVRD